MQAYIGSKIITAEPQDNPNQKPTQHDPCCQMPEPGYRVIYPDGYESWSPKHVFEEAYRPVSDGERELILGPAEAEAQC